MDVIKAEDGTVLPAPTEISVGAEIIWSSSTGRIASGKMVGTVIAEKETFSIKWGILTDSELQKIKSKLPGGFIRVTVLGELVEAYRDTLTMEYIGELADGITYWRSAATSLIQR